MPLGDTDESVFAGDADDIITKRLVTFKDIHELQKRNAELLAVVREMSANQVKAETLWSYLFVDGSPGLMIM